MICPLSHAQIQDSNPSPQVLKLVLALFSSEIFPSRMITIASVFCKAVYRRLHIARQLISAVPLRQQALKDFKEYLVLFFFFFLMEVHLGCRSQKLLNCSFIHLMGSHTKSPLRKLKSIWGRTSQTPVTLTHSAVAATRIILGALKY